MYTNDLQPVILVGVAFQDHIDFAAVLDAGEVKREPLRYSWNIRIGPLIGKLTDHGRMQILTDREDYVAKRDTVASRGRIVRRGEYPLCRCGLPNQEFRLSRHRAGQTESFQFPDEKGVNRRVV